MLKIDLSGRIAVVTGGSGELGRTITRTLARCGADVAITYLRNETGARELVEACRLLGRRAICVQTDVCDERSVMALRDTVRRELGAAHVIVNNAVIQFQWTGVLDQSLDDFESQFRSSVVHNVLMAKAFVPGMIDMKYGRVIGINTECAMQCWPKQSAYISGKAGMDRVLRVLAKEVGEHNITVNQVAPGWMISESRPDGDHADFYRKEIPLRRRGNDQDVANAVAFLASDLAGFISGLYLPVCGGNVMPAI